MDRLTVRLPGANPAAPSQFGAPHVLSTLQRMLQRTQPPGTSPKVVQRPRRIYIGLVGCRDECHALALIAFPLQVTLAFATIAPAI